MIVMLEIMVTKNLQLDIVLIMLVTWFDGGLSRKMIFSRSSVEVKYQLMTHTTSKMIHLRSLLQKLSFLDQTPMKMYSDYGASFSLPTIQPFMSRTNMLRWIAILFHIKSCRA